MSDSPLVKISAEECERLIREGSSTIAGGDTVLNLRKSYLDGEIIELRDIEVVGVVVLNVSYQFNVHISGDTVIEGIVLEERAEIGQIHIHGKSRITNITLLDKSVIHTIKISGESVVGDVTLHKNSSLVDLSIRTNGRVGMIYTLYEATIQKIRISAQSSVLGLSISGNSYVNWCEIYENAVIGDIDLFAEDYQGHLKLEIRNNGKVGNISMSDHSVLRELLIYDEAEMNNLTVLGNALFESLVIYNKAKMRSIWVYESAFFGSFSIYHYAQVGALRVQDSAYIGWFDLSGGTIKNELRLSNLATGQLVFRGSETQLPNKVFIENVSLRALRFIDFYSESLIHISGVSINEKIGGPTYLEFSRSTLPKLEIIGNNFKNFDYAIFENSRLSSAFIAGTSFPRHIQGSDPACKQNNPHNALKADFSSNQAKLFFEQLKMVFMREGNSSQAGIYQAYEQEALFKTLKWLNGWTEFSEKATLWFHRVTSFYGSFWIQGVLVLLSFSIVLYTIILWSTGGVKPIWPWKMEFIQMTEYISHYFEFINPAHGFFGKWEYLYRLEGIDNSSSRGLTWYVAAMVLLSKIFIVAIVYQIIQAFRKFGKK